MSIAQKLAKEVVNTKFEDIPAHAVKMVTDGVLDSIGIDFLGYYKDGQRFTQYAKSVGVGAAEATIVGDGSKVSAMVAAGVNHAMGQTTDFFDGGPSHPALCNLGPAGVAVAERAGAGGKELITAVALGYEISARFHRAAFPIGIATRELPPKDHSFPGETRHRATTVAIVAAKLMGLNEAQVENAIGIAWYLTPLPAAGLRRGSYGLGFCQWGIQAAILAQNDFQGPKGTIEREDFYDLAALAASPSLFYHAGTEMHLKPWISSRGNQPGLHAALDIIKEEGLKLEEIEGITLRAKKLYFDPEYVNTTPKTYFEGVFSIPWLFSMALLGYQAGPEWLTEERFNDPEALALAKKVKVEELPEATFVWDSGVRIYNDAPNEVEVVARGKVFKKRKTYGEALGSALNPMSKEQLEAKFKANAAPVIGLKQSEELVGMFVAVQDQKDVRNITRLFGPR